MKRPCWMLPLMLLAACTQEEAQPPATEPAPTAPAVAPASSATPWIAPAPVDENGLSPLNPPESTVAAPRESTALEKARDADNLEGYIAALAGREPTENLLVDALTQGSTRIVHWLCDEKGMRLTKLDKIPHSAAPAPDSPEHPCPELDEEALAGLHLLFKAYPDAAKDELTMARCIHRYCLYHYARSLRYLLSRGANPNGRDDQGRTPLDFAHYHGWQEGIDILRARGATEHTPGRSFAQKEELFIHHRCPSSSEPEPGSEPIPVVSPEHVHFFIWQDPGPDGPNGGIICSNCGASE